MCRRGNDDGFGWQEVAQSLPQDVNGQGIAVPGQMQLQRVRVFKHFRAHVAEVDVLAWRGIRKEIVINFMIEILFYLILNSIFLNNF